MSENTTRKVVTLEALEAASAQIATKAEVEAVKQQIAEGAAAGVTYATTEEVLALFQDIAQDTPTETE